ncbi:MAG: YjjG family noncanonical pyrimidine nucleotidase [Bacteroidota bacterium]
MKNYTHLFFDLDRTLWDFEKNSGKTFHEIFHHYKLGDYFSSFRKFFSIYTAINDKLWEKYRNGEIEKEFLRYERFDQTLRSAGICAPDLARKIGDDYVYQSPRKKALFPHTIPVLKYLQNKAYILCIITNGFKEVQEIKMKTGGINGFFSHVFISEDIGFQKPNPIVFDHAIKYTGAGRSMCLMIGDDLEVDVAGAANSGIDQVYFNPKKKVHSGNPTYEISSLAELKNFL